MHARKLQPCRAESSGPVVRPSCVDQLRGPVACAVSARACGIRRGRYLAATPWCFFAMLPSCLRGLVLALCRLARYRVCMAKKLLFLAVIVCVGFLAAKKLRAA